MEHFSYMKKGLKIYDAKKIWFQIQIILIIFLLEFFWFSYKVNSLLYGLRHMFFCAIKHIINYSISIFKEKT